MHRKRGRSARASPSHTLHEERTARFTAQPLSALVTAKFPCAPKGVQVEPHTLEDLRKPIEPKSIGLSVRLSV